jgi:hypothetical protein
MNKVIELGTILNNFKYNESEILDFLDKNTDKIILIEFSYVGMNNYYYIPSTFLWNNLFNTEEYSYIQVLKIINNIVLKMKNIKCICSMDLHEYTFYGGIAGITDYCKSHNIDFFLTWYEGSDVFEYIKIISMMKEINCDTQVITVPHLIDKSICKNYNEEKIYDILVYGDTTESVYPLRARVKKLLQTDYFKNIRVKIIEYKDGIFGEDLYKEINKSYLCLATCSIYNYLVSKYFEISANYSLIVGNMTEQGRDIFGDNFIEININDSDNVITNKIIDALKNKDDINKKTSINYENMQQNFSRDFFYDRIYNEIQKYKKL